MEQKKNNITIIIYLMLILTIIVFIIYKIIKTHEDRLYTVLYSEIEYKAKRCYLDKECDNTFTLSDLYEKKYLNIMYDPISKEELNRDLVIRINNNKVEFDK